MASDPGELLLSSSSCSLQPQPGELQSHKYVQKATPSPVPLVAVVFLVARPEIPCLVSWGTRQGVSRSLGMASAHHRSAGTKESVTVCPAGPPDWPLIAVPPACWHPGGGSVRAPGCSCHPSSPALGVVLGAVPGQTQASGRWEEAALPEMAPVGAEPLMTLGAGCPWSEMVERQVGREERVEERRQRWEEQGALASQVDSPPG